MHCIITTVLFAGKNKVYFCLARILFKNAFVLTKIEAKIKKQFSKQKARCEKLVCELSREVKIGAF